jgi:hypothetical protein
VACYDHHGQTGKEEKKNIKQGVSKILNKGRRPTVEKKEEK